MSHVHVCLPCPCGHSALSDSIALPFAGRAPHITLSRVPCAGSAQGFFHDQLADELADADAGDASDLEMPATTAAVARAVAAAAQKKALLAFSGVDPDTIIDPLKLDLRAVGDHLAVAPVPSCIDGLELDAEQRWEQRTGRSDRRVSGCVDRLYAAGSTTLVARFTSRIPFRRGREVRILGLSHAEGGLIHPEIDPVPGLDGSLSADYPPAVD